MALGGLVFATVLWHAWRRRLRGEPRTRIRPLAATLGTVGISISVLGLLAMLTHALIVASRSAYVLAYYSWSALFGLGGFVCSLWNKGTSRLLSCASGFGVTFLWYQISLSV
jgi:hypothetical protein